MTKARRPRLYVIDGANLLFRAFFAIPSLTNSKGLATNAIYGFTGMLLKLVRDEKPDYLAIAFDASGPTHRDALFDAYKAHRPEMPEALAVQLPFVPRLAEAFRIPFLQRPGSEADDIMATLAIRGVRDGFDVCLVSSDKDLTQLVGPHVELLDTMADRRFDAAAVEQKWGVRPDQIGDYLSLVGDTVDNVPGVPGIGAKTAAALLGQFGTLDALYDNLDSLSPAQAKRLREGRDAAILSKALVTLDSELELGVAWDALKAEAPDRSALAHLFRELEFKTLQREFVAASESAAAPTPTVVRTHSEWDSAFRTLESLTATRDITVWPLLSEDDPSRGTWVGLGLQREETRFYVTLDRTAAGGPAAAQVWSDLAAWATNEKIRWIGHDLKRLRVALAWLGIPLSSKVFDVQLASYMLDPGKYKHELTNIAVDWLQVSVEPLKGIVNKAGGVDPGTQSEPLAEWTGRLLDACTKLAPQLDAALDDPALRRLFEDVETPLSAVLAAMEHRGITVDIATLDALNTRLAAEMSELESAIHAAAGKPFTIGSPKQLGAVLFDHLGLPASKRNRTGPSTDSSTLEELAADYPIARDVLAWRACSKLRSTYTEALPKLVHPRTGRIHATFNQAVAATGRLSSSNPNLQAIPVRTPTGRLIREAFVAPPGFVLIAADYSQIELRLLAHLAGADSLAQAFRNGIDIHRATAAEMYGIPMTDVTSEMRTAAKAINFGILYGMGATRLAAELGISRKEAQAFIDRYFARYPSIRTFLDETLEAARREGEVRTLLGRRRRLPELASADRMARSVGERMAINTPIQGTAADLVKVAMVRLARALELEYPEAAIVLQVHDELVIEAPATDAQGVATLAKSIMESAVALSVPLEVSVRWSHNWSDAH